MSSDEEPTPKTPADPGPDARAPPQDRAPPPSAMADGVPLPTAEDSVSQPEDAVPAPKPALVLSAGDGCAAPAADMPSVRTR